MDDRRESERARVEHPRREHQRERDEPRRPDGEHEDARVVRREDGDQDEVIGHLEGKVDVRADVVRVELHHGDGVHLEAAAGRDVRGSAVRDGVGKVGRLGLHREEREEERAGERELEHLGDGVEERSLDDELHAVRQQHHEAELHHVRGRVGARDPLLLLEAVGLARVVIERAEARRGDAERRVVERLLWVGARVHGRLQPAAMRDLVDWLDPCRLEVALGTGEGKDELAGGEHVDRPHRHHRRDVEARAREVH
mmetsp:Transcript_11338/g.29995  ORF Transcript_11338/g.29995 Transcript_11338/m.29995 type:complete len:255 (-) Transcript_11338:3117-3881(-)